MKKDYLWFSIIGLFIFSYVLDRIAGPIVIPIRNPYLFLHQPILSTYPFTAVSVIAKAAAIVMTLLVIFSYIKTSPYLKASILFFIGALTQLYAIQQLATGGRVTPTEWTLGIAYGGAGLIPPIIILLMMGMFSTAHKAIVAEIVPHASLIQKGQIEKGQSHAN